MKLEQINRFSRNPYVQECSNCGVKQTILTQRDNGCEYATDIYLQCQCGDYILFILPVN